MLMSNQRDEAIGIKVYKPWDIVLNKACKHAMHLDNVFRLVFSCGANNISPLECLESYQLKSGP